MGCSVKRTPCLTRKRTKLMGRRLPRKRTIPSHRPGRRLHLSWLLSLPKTRSTWGQKGRPKTPLCRTTTPCWSTLTSLSQSVLRGPERGRRPRTKTARKKKDEGAKKEDGREEKKLRAFDGVQDGLCWRHKRYGETSWRCEAKKDCKMADKVTD